jgi:UDP-GlcNAc:undecaprenyl-phosphate GlcNAc-1-phosphate transferase
MWAWPITCLWLVGLCNAVNLIDGLDGLAAGVSLFATLSIFATSIRWGEAEAALLCIALAGTLLGFLRYNFYPARIFMGDAGALLLGFLLGVISIMKGSKSTSAVALLIPITALGIPILDTAVAILRRLRKRKHLFVADREHLHHRLLHIGLSHRYAVILIYLASLYLGILSFAMAFVPPSLNAVIFGALVVSGMAGGAALIFAERAADRRRSAQPEAAPSVGTDPGHLWRKPPEEGIGG